VPSELPVDWELRRLSARGNAIAALAMLLVAPPAALLGGLLGVLFVPIARGAAVLGAVAAAFSIVPALNALRLGRGDPNASRVTTVLASVVLLAWVGLACLIYTSID
jgi:hypothetical protein